MTTITRAQADEAMKFIWKIREQIREETKNMTKEERDEYYRIHSEKFEKRVKEINPDDSDLSFLRKKQNNIASDNITF